VPPAFESARLEQIERDPTRPEWIPIRRRFGIEAFAVHAWSSARQDEDLASVREDPRFARI
jgi:hypothetical protein